MEDMASSTNSLAKAAGHQATIAEKAFRDNERPRIYVFGLKPVESESDVPAGREITYFVANFGRNAAIIENVETGATEDPEFVGEASNCLLTESQSHPLMSRPVVPPGTELPPAEYVIPDHFSLVVGGTPDQREFLRPALGKPFYFRIRVTYRGPTTRDHYTDIMWRWDENTGSYVTSNDYRYAQYDGENDGS